MSVPYPRAIERFPVLRQSLLSSYDNCALGTKFEMNYRKGWHFDYQARGELFHRFASRALVTLVQHDEDQLPVDVALSILHEVLRQDDVDRECPSCGSGKIRRGITKRGMRYCMSCRRQFESRIITVPLESVAELYWVVKKFAHDNRFNVRNLVDVEKRLTAQVHYANPEGGSVERTVTGQFDALLVEGAENERAVVLDWKDMWKLPPQTELGHKGYFQQRFYAFLIFSDPLFKDVQEVTLREFYVRYSEPREATLSRQYDFENTREEVAALVERFDRAVEQSLWVPSPGAHCGFCVAPQKCSIFPEARGAGRITSEQEAQTVAAQFIVASAIVKQQRDQLKGWCQQHGPVPVRDAKGARVIGFQEYDRTEHPTTERIAQEEALRGRPLRASEIAAMERKQTSTKLTTFVPRREEIEADDGELIRQLQESVRAAQAEVAA